jgi:hypothetical protein
VGDIVKFPDPQSDCIIQQNPDGRCHLKLDVTLSVEDTLFLVMAIRTLERGATIRLGKEVRLPFGVC